MSKKMNAGEAAAVMLKVKAAMEPAWSNLSVLEEIHKDIAGRLSVLYDKRQSAKPNKEVTP